MAFLAKLFGKKKDNEPATEAVSEEEEGLTPEEEAAAAKAAAEAPAPEPSAEEKLLTEIRDLLKEKK